MIKKLLFLPLLLIGEFCYSQCTSTQAPTSLTNLVVTINRPHTDPHLNWYSVQNACEYVINAKIVEKSGNSYTERQASGYPFILPHNPRTSSQDCWDRIALQLSRNFKGGITLKYEVSSRNNIGTSSPIMSQYVRIH